MKTSYNKRADVLYMVILDTTNHCTYTESPSGVIARVDDVTHQVVGFTVYDYLFKKHAGIQLTAPSAVDPQLLNRALEEASPYAEDLKH